ncbi:MAG: hypothetical protein QM811_19965 [Pirellulales bacterium]
MLRDVERLLAGSDRHDLGHGADGFDRNVFELQRRSTDAPGKLQQRGAIVVFGRELAFGNLRGGAVLFGTVSPNSIAQPCGGQREHAAELTVA